MGCVASAPAADGAGAQGNGGAASAPAAAVPKAAPRGESCLPHTLARMRTEFLRGVTPGTLLDTYTLGDVVGTGTYGVVRRATHRATRQEVAVKILRLPASMRSLAGASLAAPSGAREDGPENDLDEEDILKEVAILRGLDSPFVIKLLAYYLAADVGVVYLVTELLPGGQLLDALLATQDGAYSEHEARLAFTALLHGLHYLHTRGITHRDVKLDNLLLARAGELSSAKLVDFGLAAACFESDPKDEPGMRWLCGSAAYLAPEVYLRKVPYDCACDMWSAGVVLHLLLTGLTPFATAGGDDAALKDAAAKGFVATLDGPEWNHVSGAAKSLVRALLTVEPGERATATRALMHEWVLTGDGSQAKRAAPQLAGTLNQLRSYAAAAQLPVVSFPKGALLSTKGEQCGTVYLIKKGTVEVLMPLSSGGTEEATLEEADATDDAVDASAAPAAAERARRAKSRGSGGAPKYRLVATRSAGDLVGDIGVVMDRVGRASIVAAPTPGLTPSYSVASSLGDEGSTRGSESEPEAPPDGTPIDDWAAIVLAKRCAKRWVGKTRVATLRAATPVEAVSLQRDQLKWVLEHDERIAREVEAFVAAQPGGSVHGTTAAAAALSAAASAESTASSPA